MDWVFIGICGLGLFQSINKICWNISRAHVICLNCVINSTVCLVRFFYKLKPTHIIVTKELHGPVVTQMNTSDKGIWLRHWAAAMETSQISTALKYNHNSIIDKDRFLHSQHPPAPSYLGLEWNIYWFFSRCLWVMFYTQHALNLKVFLLKNNFFLNQFLMYLILAKIQQLNHKGVFMCLSTGI